MTLKLVKLLNISTITSSIHFGKHEILITLNTPNTYLFTKSRYKYSTGKAPMNFSTAIKDSTLEIIHLYLGYTMKRSFV